MKINSKILLVVLALSSLSVASMAQSAGPSGGHITQSQSGGRAHRLAPVQVLFQNMKLSKDERKQVAGIMKDGASQLKDFRKSNPGDRQGLKALVEKVRTDEDSKLKAILTPDQYSRWTAWQDASKLKKFNEDQRALRAAGLTPDEMKSVRKLKGQARYDALVAIAKNPSDSATVDQAKSSAEAAYQTGLSKLLTSDQYSAYQAALKNPGKHKK